METILFGFRNISPILTDAGLKSSTHRMIVVQITSMLHRRRVLRHSLRFD